MSSINTNGINVNYPVPGQNNSTQGFRDNFANIRENLNTAGNEITDLQNKVLLKQALANSVLNNDMAGALISNATTLNFRASTYNLGNALSGTVLIDVSRGDVQYGNIAANTVFQFGGWAPINTQSSIILNLGISNANAVISFPSEVTANPNGYGIDILENVKVINGVNTVQAPSNVEILSYQCSTLDCGNTIYITPLNRPFQTTQIASIVPPSTGQVGDMLGTISVGPQVEQVTISETSNTTVVVNSTTVRLNECELTGTTLNVFEVDVADMRNCSITDNQLFVGYLESGNIQIGMELTGSNIIPGTTIVSLVNSLGGSSTWLVDTPQTIPTGTNLIGTPSIQVGMLLSGPGVLANTWIVNNNSGDEDMSVWTISQSHTPTGVITATAQTGIVETSFYLGSVVSGNVEVGARLIGDDIAENTFITSFNGVNIYTVSVSQYASPTSITAVRNAITCNSTALFYPDMPIVFTGNVYGNLMAGTTYYVKDVMTSTDFSVTLTPGGDGSTFVLQSNTGVMYGNPINYMYVCTQSYNGVEVGPKIVTNTYATTNYVKLDNVVGLLENSPIRFAGQTIGNLSQNNWYYIKQIDAGNSNISLSLTKVNGVAGSVLELPTSNALSSNSCQAYSINGSDIWRQIALIPNYNQSNISAASLTVSDTLNVYGNAFVLGNLEVTGTVTYDEADYNNLYAEAANLENITSNNITSNTLTVLGLVTLSSNANLKLQGGTSGQYLQTDGAGNLLWADGTETPGANSAGGANTQIQFNDGSVLGGVSGFEFVKTSNLLSIPGDLYANNNNNSVYTNNLTVSNVLTANTGAVALPDVANLTIDGGTAGYYLQSNGAGGLVWAGGTGNLTGNGTANGVIYTIQYSAGDGNFYANTDFTFNPANANLNVPGNVILSGNVIANGSVFANGNITADYITGTLDSGSASQPNITSLGTLTSLTVNGSINANALFANTGTTIDPDNVAGFAAGKVVQTGFYPAPGKPGIVIGNSTGQHGAIVYDSTAPGIVFGTESGNANSMVARARLFSNNTFKVDYLDGTLLTANQSAITKVGTLSSLSVTGNINTGNIVGSLANGLSSVKIPTASGNVNISAYGNANILVVGGTGVTVNGNIGTTGNVTSNGNSSGFTGAFVNTSGNSIGNLDVSGPLVAGIGIRALESTFTDTSATATSSISFAAAHAIAAPFYAAANNNVTLSEAATFAIMGEPDNGANVTLNPDNAYALYANGKVLVANHITTNANLYANNIEVASNTITDNLIANSASFSAVNLVNIPGGSAGYYLQTDGNGLLSWSPGTLTGSGNGVSYGSANQIQVANGIGGFTAFAGFAYDGGNLSVPGNITATSNIFGTIRTGAQPGITSVGGLTSLTVIGNISTTSATSGIKSRSISVEDSQTGNVDSNNMSLVGRLGFRTFPATYTSNAAGTSTIANAAIHIISSPNIAASNTGVTLTNASTFLIKGAPVAGANVTITNPYALTVDGNSKFTGVTTFDANVNACATVRFANISSVKIGNAGGGTAGYYIQTDGLGNLQWSAGTIDAISAPGGSDKEIQYNNNGNLDGLSTLTYDSSNLNLTGNLVTTGNAFIGAVKYTNIAPITNGYVLAANTDGTTYWSTSGAGTSIASGTSNVQVVTTNGNINLYPSGNFINLMQNTISTGNFYVGATTATAVKYTGTQSGSNGYALLGNTDGVTYWAYPSSISNGTTSQVSFVAGSGNIKFGVGANANIMSIAVGGITINNGPLTVGAVTYTNAYAGPSDDGKVLTISGGVTSWTAAGGGSGSIISNATSTVSIPVASGNVNISVSGNANIITVTGTGANVTGNFDVSGTINAVTGLTVGTGTGPTGNVQYISERGSGNGYVLAIDTSNGATYWRNITTGASSIAYSTSLVDITASGNVRLIPSVITSGGGKVVVESNTSGTTELVINGQITGSGNIVTSGKLQAGAIIYTNVSPPDTTNRYLKLNSDFTTTWSAIPSGTGSGGTYIANGSSNVYVANSDGPIYANVNANTIAVFKSTGIETSKTIKIGDVAYTNVAGTANEGKYLKLGPGGVTSWDSPSSGNLTLTKIEQGSGKVEVQSDGSILLRPTDAAAGNITMSRNSGTLTANIVGNLNLQGVGSGYIKAKGFVFDAEAIYSITTNLTVNSTQNGRVIYSTSSSAITVTINPASLGTGFSCVIIQGGAGQITMSGTNSVGGKTKSSGQYAVMTVFVVSSSVAILSGDITT